MRARLVILITIVGIVILAVISTVSHPVSVKLTDISAYEGRDVVVCGRVLDKRETSADNTLLRLQSENTVAPVFVKGFCSVSPGDEVRITGRVQYYGGEYELVVSDSKNVAVTRAWPNNNISLAQLKSQVEKYTNTNINVTGYACTVTSSGFTLADSIDTSCRSSIRVIIRKTLTLPTERSPVYVMGELIYDSNSFSYFIKLESAQHGVGILVD